MKLLNIISILFIAASVSGCSVQNDADVYSVSAEPYSAFTDDDVRYRECRIELGDRVFISGSGAWFGADGIKISEGGVYLISGTYDGTISVSAKDPVKLVFSSANISNPNGFAVISKAERLIISSENGNSTLSGCGGEYATAVYSEGKLLLGGPGGLSVTGNIFSAGGIMFGGNANTACQIVRSDNGDLIYGSLRIN